jgi:hypothetical protein
MAAAKRVAAGSKAPATKGGNELTRKPAANGDNPGTKKRQRARKTAKPDSSHDSLGHLQDNEEYMKQAEVSRAIAGM